MADDKKKDSKKEEKKSDPFGEYSTLWVIFGGAFLLSIFLSNLNGTIFNIQNKDGESKIGFPAGEIIKNQTVVNKEVTLIRNTPAGGVIGKQEKYTKAEVDEGPVEAYGKTWWRLDYDKAPDGWVEEGSVTAHTDAYLALNIIPIAWKYVKIGLWVLSVILFGMIVYAKTRLEAAQEEAERKINAGEIETVPHIDLRFKEVSVLTGETVEGGARVGGDTPQSEREGNTRWAHVLQLMESYNQSDWRQSIIEADIILEEMLEKMGYDGVSIGDKLKNVESADFLTINQAWEAHKYRNRIAHMGSNFKITQSEARKVIGLYQEVFEEFYFI